MDRKQMILTTVGPRGLFHERYAPKVIARSVNYRYVMERDDRGEPVETLDWWYVDEPEPAE